VLSPPRRLSGMFRHRFRCSNSVELRGIEPLTFSMRTRRATNCAIAPDRKIRLPVAAGGAETLLAYRPR
jgi:hypothetical protein